MTVATCKLCEQTRELRDSHLFPEFLFRSVYDEKHRAVGVSPVSAAKHKILQKAPRERLLCQDCETLFSKLERYAASVLRRLPDTAYTRPGKLAITEDVDYTQFKLFQLSLLWRASVARQPSFGEVDLGPHESALRSMLLSNNPGEPLDYPCLIARTAGAESLAGMVKFPGKNRLMGHRIYHLVAAGLIWVFFVSSHTRDIREHLSFLSRANKLPINISSITADQFISGLAKNLNVLGVL